MPAMPPKKNPKTYALSALRGFIADVEWALKEAKDGLEKAAKHGDQFHGLLGAFERAAKEMGSAKNGIGEVFEMIQRGKVWPDGTAPAVKKKGK